MKNITSIAMIAIAILTTLNVKGQHLLKCDTTTSYWTFENENSFFTVKISGKISEQETKSIIAVNNYSLQYIIVDKKNYIKADSNAADLTVLTNYAMSEAEYMTGLFKQNLNVQIQNVPLSSDKTVLIWFFEMPLSISQAVKHQVFVNIIIGDKIIGLSSSQFAYQKLDDVKDFLMDVISTLKKIDNKNDLEKLCKH